MKRQNAFSCKFRFYSPTSPPKTNKANSCLSRLSPKNDFICLCLHLILTALIVVVIFSPSEQKRVSKITTLDLNFKEPNRNHVVFIVDLN